MSFNTFIDKIIKYFPPGLSGNLTCKLVSALIVVALGVTIACLADSYHKINEGNVGIYYKHGALQASMITSI